MTAAEMTKERLYEAEVNRVAGEVALKSPERDVTKAETYFERALAVARQQQAKSWELRAAIVWRGSGVKVSRSLAPIYAGSLLIAKALLDELHA
jgi:predicted ATPase